MEEELRELEKKVKEDDSIELKEKLIETLDKACDLYEKDKPNVFFGMCVRKQELAKEIYLENDNDDYRYLYARCLIDVGICLLNQEKSSEGEQVLKEAFDLLINSDEEDEDYFDNHMNLDGEFLSLLIDCADTYGSVLEELEKLVPAFNVYMKKYNACLEYQDNNEDDIIDEINNTITNQLLPILEQIENYSFAMEICEAYFDFNEKNYSKKNEEFKYVINYYKKCCKELNKKEELNKLKKRFK